MNGPRCIGASRGPTSSLLRRISGTHQFDLRIEKRVAFALRSCGYVQIVGGATRLAAAVRLKLRRDLAVEQGHWLVPVASCSSPRVVRGHGPHPLPAVRSHDWTAMPARQEAKSFATPTGAA